MEVFNSDKNNNGDNDDDDIGDDDDGDNDDGDNDGDNDDDDEGDDDDISMNTIVVIRVLRKVISTKKGLGSALLCGLLPNS